MSQILIKLGCEDLQLKRTSDQFVFSEQSIADINALLLKIEQSGKSLGRYGFSLERFFNNLIHLPYCFLNLLLEYELAMMKKLGFL